MTIIRLFIAAFFSLSVATITHAHAEDICDASASWLLAKMPASNAQPMNHKQFADKSLPDADCPFYQNAWQRFLIATKSDGKGVPDFLTYPTIRDVFVPSVPTLRNVDPALPLLDAGINQAKSQGILIDQNGNPVFYAIHVNAAFKTFVSANGLRTVSDLQKVKQDLALPSGIVELKSAWEIVPDTAPLTNYAKYFTVRAQVPCLTIVNGAVVPTQKVRNVTVALLALHVVFSLDNHPELIWTTFEHINSGGGRDNAPAASVNPAKNPTDPIDSLNSYPLYKPGTLIADTYVTKTLPNYASFFDEATQSFVKTGVLSTPVYRLFPGSKSDGMKPDDSAEDGDVHVLDHNVAGLFTSAWAADKRRFYQLVGGIWLDDSSGTNPAKQRFEADSDFSNDPGATTDDPNSPVAGEDRLSSTAMESFTQSETGISIFPNCFSCHDTHAVKSDKRPGGLASEQLMPAARLNVSHVFSKFVDDTNFLPVDPPAGASCPSHP